MFQNGEEPRFARDVGNDDNDDDDDEEEEENEEPLSDSIENDEPESEGKTKTRNHTITSKICNTTKVYKKRQFSFWSQNLMIIIIGERS